MTNVTIISPADVQAWMQAGDVILIDVREVPEYQAANIAGSTLIPLSILDSSKVPVPPEDKKLVLHCRSGVRCGMAAQKLVDQGRTHPIYRMQGGINAWISSGLPVKQG